MASQRARGTANTGTAVWVASVCGLLLLYVLSIGPVGSMRPHGLQLGYYDGCFYCTRLKASGLGGGGLSVDDGLIMLYRPLVIVCHNVPPVRNAVNSYMSLWGMELVQDVLDR
ncbi:MAG: hypothetical protein ACAI35_20815 [Candidatus Methylacidiphilales bacterium]|nr:hypothetical protein [Candidatus Methylacidiphilales bacterium]